MSSSSQSTRTRFDARNLLLVLGSPLIFFAAIELVLAALGVKPVRYEQDPYVGFYAHSPLFVEQRGGDGRLRMETAANKRRLFNLQSFPAEKPDGVFRVFCLGGSTTFGRPYDDTTSFCGWLRELLPRADPSRTWELINAGGISYASYRTALLMEELISYEPDLFIVYSGHNEFLERRTYGRAIATPRAVVGMTALAARTRTWALMLRIGHTLSTGKAGRERSAAPSDSPSPVTVLAPEVKTLLDAAVGPSEYTRDDEYHKKVLDHYRFNLARMVGISRAVDADILFVTPAANLRDSTPFKSEPGAELGAADRERLGALVEEASAALAQGRPEEALAAAFEAASLDERHANAQYQYARALDALGRSSQAEVAYKDARDEDICPLRAPGRVHEIVREVAAELGVPVVDFVRLISDSAPEGIPGEESFYDHVHPFIDKHLELALEIVSSMQETGLLARSADLGEEAVQQVRQRVENRLDPAAHARALLNLSKVLGWAGKFGEAGRLAIMATELQPELAEAHYQAGISLYMTGRPGEAIPHYRKSLETAPGVAATHGNLAAALEADGETLQAIHHYRLAIELLGKTETSYKSELAMALRHLGATP